jgi:hypothetical protein
VPYPSQPEIRLRRPWYARTLAGNPAQIILSLSLVLIIGLWVGISLALGVPSLKEYPVGGYVVIAVLLGIWGIGATANAYAGDDGVRWRYLRRVQFRWDEIERVLLTTHPSAFGSNVSMEVRVAGKNHRVAPANACGRWRIRFGGELVRLAAQHGVATEINDADRRWDGARAIGSTSTSSDV